MEVSVEKICLILLAFLFVYCLSRNVCRTVEGNSHDKECPMIENMGLTTSQQSTVTKGNPTYQAHAEKIPTIKTCQNSKCYKNDKNDNILKLCIDAMVPSGRFTGDTSSPQIRQEITDNIDRIVSIDIADIVDKMVEHGKNIAMPPNVRLKSSWFINKDVKQPIKNTQQGGSIMGGHHENIKLEEKIATILKSLHDKYPYYNMKKLILARLTTLCTKGYDARGRKPSGKFPQSYDCVPDYFANDGKDPHFGWYLRYTTFEYIILVIKLIIETYYNDDLSPSATVGNG